jgi:trehalose/maltose hydrolase-like predicted phosphorylase
LYHEDWDHNRHWLAFDQKIEKNESFAFTIVGSETSTEHYVDPMNEAERLTIYAALEGEERLLNRHNQAWEKLWESDIIIEGNIEDQRSVRSALYHLYSFGRAGTSYSPSPMGLSGLGYNGHVFWDTELWMYPAVLVMHPEIAKSFINYRTEKLDQAKMNAFAHGYEGAMFPWESDDTGQESTPVWARTGPYEHHITATVAIAFWNYYRVTKDKEWLKTEGYEVLKEIANFWVSRAEEGNNGEFHIRNVVGADEWAENIDDNAFTNGAAKTALSFATKAANELGLEANPEWKKVEEGIVLLAFEDGVTREHATYEGEPIKQADVNLLAFPLDVISDEATIQKDLTYYEPRIGDGPAMSHSVLSVLNARLGNIKEAYRLFKRGFEPNKVPPFGVIAENAGGTNPYFATGAGGMLQAVLFGFGGLELTDQGLLAKGIRLPDSWTSLTITGIGVDNLTISSE